MCWRRMIRGTGSPGSPTGTVGGFDVIVTDQDDWLFNAEKTLYYAQREDWTDIPEAQRNTRQELQAAADAYLDLFKDKSVAGAVGHALRAAGGQRLHRRAASPTDSCNVGVPENIDMADRRYVIDPVVGSVAVFLRMGAEQAARRARVPHRGRQDPLHPHRDQLRHRRELRLRPVQGDGGAQSGLLSRTSITSRWSTRPQK